MNKLPDNARWLGLAGLLPQIAAVAAVIHGGEARWTALALSFGYAALIFSFLGGVWWGLALAAPRVPRWTFAVSVLPSLIALALWYPWMVGDTWPGPELVVLGALIAAGRSGNRFCATRLDGVALAAVAGAGRLDDGGRAHRVTTSRFIGASLARKRFCAANGMPRSRMARCRSVTSAFMSRVLIPNWRCASAMSRPV